MCSEVISEIGLFSSDPNSRRVESLEESFRQRGVQPVRIIPWKVTSEMSRSAYKLRCGETDLRTLDRMLVLDLGGMETGTFLHRVGILSAIEDLGVEVINSVWSILQMRNKAECLRRLMAAGLRVPDTLITESIDVAADFVLEKHPCVLKPVVGFGGMGVQLIQDAFDIDHIYDYLKFHSHLTGKGTFLLQELIAGPGFDIRALVLEGEVIATMQRFSEDGIATNIHAGGVARPNDIDVTNQALEAASCVEGRIVGVDIMPDKDGDLYVLEVNATPGWAGIQSVTDFDISNRIADELSRL
ncbi:RimK family alpha-L-glutamate ligase [Candidatus Thorarchaeota archaeon]|nr:MAG: RimK family alpha-L-glutamate ligase [Candidatus Thorarchaeota archaeon]